MEPILLIIIAIVIAVVIFSYVLKFNTHQEQIKTQQEQKRLERIANKENKEQEFDLLLKNRASEFGDLTKKINFCYNKANDIFVYEQTKIIFISGKKYDFRDILSCKIDKETIKGQTTYTTTPDKYQMAEQQVLWGMGKKYNVKTTIQTKTAPDTTIYYIYIGINSLTIPQISLTLHSSEKANEINSLMNVIINSNTNEQLR